MSEAIVKSETESLLKTTQIHCARCPSTISVPVVDEVLKLPEAWFHLFAKGGEVAKLKKEVELPNKWRSLYVPTQQTALGYLCPQCASETSQYLLLDLDLFAFIRFFGHQIAKSGEVDNAVAELARYLNSEAGAKVLREFLYFKPPPALGGKTGRAEKALPAKSGKRKALPKGKR